MTRALVIVDIQNDYFPGGAFTLPGAQAAAANAAVLLAVFRSARLPVVHVQHIWDAPDAEFMAPGTWGSETSATVAPARDERTIVKHFPNAFRETDLLDHLSALAAHNIVVCGMMSNLCVDSTVRAASDLGLTVTLAHDACAASDLAFEGVEVPAIAVHAAFMAALAEYATVVQSAEIVAALA